MKKLVYSLSVLCVILAVACFTLLCCYLCACDGYSRVCIERNAALNNVEKLKRENRFLRYEIEHPRKNLVTFAQYENSWTVR